MWQPGVAQWRLIWVVTVVLILSWPPDHGRSLGLKLVNWVADPANSLAALPDPLPIGLDDNGDAVTAHDAQTAEYYRQYGSSGWIRLRMKLKSAADPVEPSTQRQILAGVGILSALVIWRMNSKLSP